MALIEVILSGLQIENLQKPFVFVVTLVGLLVFGFAAVAILVMVVQGLIQGVPFLPSLGMILGSIVFFGLTYTCAHLMKRCFD